MSGTNRRGWTAAFFLFIGIEAVGFQLRGALLPSLDTAFTVSESLLGLVATAGTIGFAASVLAVGFVAGRLDLKRTLLFGVTAIAACVFLLGSALSYAMYLLALLARGIATGVFRAVDRPVLGHLYPRRRGRIFNLYGLVWAIGATAGPLVVSAALALGNWRLAYFVLVAGFLLVAVLVWRLDLDLGGVESELALADLRAVLREPAIVGMAAALVLVGGIEGTVFTWLPYFAGEYVRSDLANLALSVYLAAYVPGRLVHSVVVDRLGHLALVGLAALAGVPLSILSFAVATDWLLFVAVFALGFGTSAAFPTLSAFGMDAVPEYSAPANAIATAAVYAGIATIPALVGVVADLRTIETAMALVVPLFAGLSIVVFLTRAATDGD